MRCLIVIGSLLAAALDPGLVWAEGDEYRLLVQTIGVRKVPQATMNPRKVVLDSLEVVCRPGEKFRGRATHGPSTILLTGTFDRTADGTLKVRLCYEVANDTGIMVPAPDGGEEPIINRRRVENQLDLALDKPTAAGGLQTKTDETDATGRVTSTWTEEIVHVTISKN